MKIAVHFGLLFLAAGSMAVMDVADAHAQSASCAQLQSNLRTLERNGDFRNLQSAQVSAQQYAQAVQDAESLYVRSGCMAQQQTGQLDRQCRVLARQILSGRQDRDNLNRAVETGNAVAQQREAVLQEMARFQCNSGSQNADNELDGGFRRDRNTVFDQMFGTNGQYQDGQIVDYGWGGTGGYYTVRTVCVRLSDGYFWPISYATLTEYTGNDAQMCSAQCPNQPVALYFYENPGQEPEQMVSLTGEPYSNLPTAFAYRRTFDPANTCKVKKDEGAISVAQSSDGSSRPIISYGEQNFPLPMRDPRQVSSAPVTVAQIQPVETVSVPLPRRRPSADGTPVAVTPAADPAQRQARIVEFGGKRVRIVGPETPYAQVVEAGT